jgi:hypothetical protein
MSSKIPDFPAGPFFGDEADGGGTSAGGAGFGHGRVLVLNV